MKYEDHEIAACWRLMNLDELFALSKSIKENGLRFPVVLYEGKILDGRNRYRACQTAEVEPKFEDFKGGDPLQFAIDANRERRHDTSSQRAMAAAKLSNIKLGNVKAQSGAPAGAPERLLVSRQEAADIMQVGRSSVDRAKQVLAQAPPEIIEKVESGELPVNTALTMISRPSVTPEPTDERIPALIPSEALVIGKKAVSILRQIPEADRLRRAAFTEVYKFLLFHYPNLK